MNKDYIAGFFDGEGCIYLSRRKPEVGEMSRAGFFIVPVIIIVQKNLDILESIRDYLSSIGIGCFIKPRTDKCSQLIISGMKRCIKFCDEFYDKIYVKKEQVILVRNYINKRLSNPQNTPYDGEDLDLIDKLSLIKKL